MKLKSSSSNRTRERHCEHKLNVLWLCMTVYSSTDLHGRFFESTRMKNGYLEYQLESMNRKKNCEWGFGAFIKLKYFESKDLDLQLLACCSPSTCRSIAIRSSLLVAFLFVNSTSLMHSGCEQKIAIWTLNLRWVSAMGWRSSDRFWFIGKILQWRVCGTKTTIFVERKTLHFFFFIITCHSQDQELKIELLWRIKKTKSVLPCLRKSIRNIRETIFLRNRK